MKTFLDTFTKLKNVDFKETEGLSELSKMRIDEKEFDELKSMVNFAASLTGGAVAGTAGGALVAFGAYGRSTGSRLCINRHRHRIVERSSGNQRHARVFRRRIDCCGRLGMAGAQPF